MKTLVIALLLATPAFAQTTTCTSRTNGDTTYTDCNTQQPIPLPALNVQPPQPINTNLLAMAAIASSNAPSKRQLKKYCKKHPGEPWVWHNFYGVEVARGQCAQ
jgi:hypothetical protein